MVSLKEHVALCRKILGKPYTYVHQLVDVEYYSLRGRHRVTHDFDRIWEIAYLTNDVNAFWAGFIHYWQDGELVKAYDRSYGVRLVTYLFNRQELLELEWSRDVEKLKRFIIEKTEDVKYFLEKDRKANKCNVTLHISPMASGCMFAKEVLKYSIIPYYRRCILCNSLFRINYAFYAKASYTIDQSRRFVEVLLEPELLRKSIVLYSRFPWLAYNNYLVVADLCLKHMEEYSGWNKFPVLLRALGISPERLAVGCKVREKCPYATYCSLYCVGLYSQLIDPLKAVVVIAHSEESHILKYMYKSKEISLLRKTNLQKSLIQLHHYLPENLRYFI